MDSGELDADKIRKGKRKLGEGSKVYTRRFKKGTNNGGATSNNDQTVSTVDADSQKRNTSSRVVEALDNSSGQNRQPEVVAATRNESAGDRVGTPAVARVYDRVKINLKLVTSKNETKELSEKLRAELDQVRGLVQKLEHKNAELTSSPAVRGAASDGETYSRLQFSGNDVIEKRALLRVDSEMGTDYMERRALARVNDTRALTRVSSEVSLMANQARTPFRQLSVAVVDKSHVVGEFVEKEKRTPKANRYYRNTEFLLGKDRLPLESNKKPKSSGGRKHSRESDFAASLEKHRVRVFKSCSNLLQRLMKHKHGWVFNDPVDATVLGLHDYHEIVQHPMDLGTIKSRLAQNFYKFPKEFAGDIRLTFCNAMTYNPKGQDVHLMAEQLLNLFEERWAAIEAEYNPDQMYASAFNPTSRTISQISTRFISKQKPSNFTLVSRTHVLKKPKAKDPNKRDMTYEEKQKLGKNLQSLPSEKLDNIVQIIKKTTSSLPHDDDELEVDINGVDVETLWELDRFFTNYKKNLSKRKRKAVLAQRARTEAGNDNQAVVEHQTSVVEALKEIKPDEKSTPDQGDKRRDNISRSSSTSSSSSDSGSSSSDSDSDTSTADGPDAGGSPRS